MRRFRFCSAALPIKTLLFIVVHCFWALLSSPVLVSPCLSCALSLVIACPLISSLLVQCRFKVAKRHLVCVWGKKLRKARKRKWRERTSPLQPNSYQTTCFNSMLMVEYDKLTLPDGLICSAYPSVKLPMENLWEGAKILVSWLDEPSVYHHLCRW